MFFFQPTRKKIVNAIIFRSIWCGTQINLFEYDIYIWRHQIYQLITYTIREIDSCFPCYRMNEIWLRLTIFRWIWKQTEFSLVPNRNQVPFSLPRIRNRFLCVSNTENIFDIYFTQYIFDIYFTQYIFDIYFTQHIFDIYFT